MVETSLLKDSCLASIQIETGRARRRNQSWQRSFILALGCCSLLLAEAPSRLHANLRDGQTFELTGNVHPRIATASDLGAASASLPLERVTIHLQRSAAQQTQLDQLLAEQQRTGSAQYHKWLTPEQFADRFGASTADIAKLTSWLKEEGFTNVQVARSRSSVSASGTAAQAEATFQTTIHRFQDATGVRFANVSDPVLPAALRGFVSSISGLNNFHLRSHVAVHQHPHLTSALSGNHYMVPGDFATIYDLQSLYNQGINGTGQKIAIVGETDINLAQVATFRSNLGLSVNPPQVIVNGVDPGVVADEQIEAYLDVEWAGAIAPNATIIFVNSKQVFDSEVYAIDNNLAPVLSITYGLCEAQQGSTTTENALFQQANAEGMTVSRSFRRYGRSRLRLRNYALPERYQRQARSSGRFPGQQSLRHRRRRYSVRRRHRQLLVIHQRQQPILGSLLYTGGRVERYRGRRHAIGHRRRRQHHLHETELAGRNGSAQRQRTRRSRHCSECLHHARSIPGVRQRWYADN